jgi:hypothetical protein
MRRNAKSLQRNDEAGKGILIALSKLPRFPRSLRFPRCAIPPKALDRESASGPISRRGWQADGCLNEFRHFHVESIFTTAPERVDSVSCG